MKRMSLVLLCTVLWFCPQNAKSISNTDLQERFDTVRQKIIDRVKSDSDTERMRSPVFVKQTYRSAREARQTADRLTDTYAGAPIPGGTPISIDQANQLAVTYKETADFDLTDANFADKVRPIKTRPTESFFDLIETRLQKATDTNTSLQSANTSDGTVFSASHAHRQQGTMTPPTDEQRARLLAHQKELRKQLGRRSFLINLNLF